MAHASRSLIARDPTRELEARVGVASFDDLAAERLELVKQAAPIRARREMFDARRKERRSAISALITRDQGDMSEAKLERLASGDPRYKSYLDDAELAFAQLAVLEIEIQTRSEKIRRDDALIRYAASEPK